MERFRGLSSNVKNLNELLAITTMTLATSGKDGTPHAAPVYFAADEDMCLFFFSSPKSQHSKDIKANPQAAVAIYSECKNWQDIHGLQLRGFVNIVSNVHDKIYAWKIFTNKFPFMVDLKNIVKVNKIYVFKTQWIRLIDNRIRFGFKKEWVLD